MKEKIPVIILKIVCFAFLAAVSDIGMGREVLDRTVLHFKAQIYLPITEPDARNEKRSEGFPVTGVIHNVDGQKVEGAIVLKQCHFLLCTWGC